MAQGNDSLITRSYDHGRNILRLRYFSKFYFLHEWNEAWLLVINLLYMSCRTTSDLASLEISSLYQKSVITSKKNSGGTK